MSGAFTESIFSPPEYISSLGSQGTMLIIPPSGFFFFFFLIPSLAHSYYFNIGAPRAQSLHLFFFYFTVLVISPFSLRALRTIYMQMLPKSYL